jgi:hypothetical protein
MMTVTTVQMLLGVGAAAFEAVGVRPVGIQTVGVGADAFPAGCTTFGIFGWFQVTHFDVFLCISHISYPAALGYLFVLCKWHRTTIDRRQRHFP